MQQNPLETCIKTRKIPGIFRFASRSDLPLLGLGSLLIILSAVASPMQTLIYGKIFDRLGRFFSGDYNSSQEFLHDLRVLVGAMMAIAGGRLLFSWLGICVWLIVGENTQMNARDLFFESLLNKDIEWLGTKENLMGSLTMLFRCIEEIRSGISENLGLFVQTVASVCCLFVIAMISLWSLTLIVCCLIPLSALCSIIFGSLTSKYATRENLANARALKVLDWCFNCGATVRVLTGKFQDLVQFSQIVNLSAVAFTNMAFAISANLAVLKLLSNLVVIGGLAFGEFLVRTNRLGLGNVVTAFSACVLFGTEISSVGDIVALLNKAQASSNTIDTLDFEDNAVTPLLPLDSSTSEVSCFSQKTPCQTLNVENLSFRYRNTSVDVLSQIDLNFSSSSLNFLVGESGSGKSTVALLFTGFLDKSEGDISVDDVSFDCLPSDWFTENVCFVELRPLVFERLLAENLLLGSPVGSRYGPQDEATRVLLEEACDFADLLGFVEELPQSFSTVLVSSKLSGGQIQKIGLARAWIANRPILILDEALGSINKKLKLRVMQNIRQWRKGCLTVIISHDLTDIHGDDFVALMEKGQVKASGLADSLREVLPTIQQKQQNPDFLEDSESGISEDRSISEKAPSYDYLNNPAILRDLEQTAVEVPQHANPEKTQAMGLFRIAVFCYATTEHKLLITLGLLCSLLSGVATPGLSYCFAEVLSLIVKTTVPGAPKSKYSVVTWSLIIVAVAVAELMATFCSRMSLQYALEQWILKLRKQCLERINDQDMAFFSTSKPAHLTTLLMNDTRDLRNLVSEFLSGVLLVVSLTGLGLVWAIVIGWKLALVGVSFVPLVLLVTLAYSLLLQKYETGYKDHVADTERFSLEVVSAMRTVRSFGLSRQLSCEHKQRLSRLYRAGTKRAIAGGFGLALLDLCSTAATATVLYYGMFLVVHNQYTQRQMLQVLTMLTFTVASASYLMKLLPEIARGQRAGTLITRLLGLAELPMETGGLLKKTGFGTLEPVVTFENVSFSYPDVVARSYKPVLRGLNLKIYPGEAVVIAGECGSGKSTLAQLLVRLYHQDRGVISYLGNDIRQYDPEWYRQNVAMVSQEPAFFEATIRENLLYGLTGSERFNAESLVAECLQAANALEFTDALPKKLDTIIGKDCLFSLGQMQRLSIARVLLRKPKVIIFDEPTSRLDAENSRLISALILQELRQRDPSLTTIVISHDPHVMAKASRVVMVQEGNIAEEGCYEDLLQKGEAFAAFLK